ncbi:hypothetical protein Pyn_41216 [Prunus yedoensis var. nudiflora]|uniref:Uncharacterized protein n=1 Tax=Prunus yedoensis var. nudiflora TaxID=2094558 RepID=A0A314UB95_PRUYE|nr:hypothetical protein Pyn_41216 [Prunus yedoensis var. nudiflora]
MMSYPSVKQTASVGVVSTRCLGFQILTFMSRSWSLGIGCILFVLETCLPIPSFLESPLTEEIEAREGIPKPSSLAESLSKAALLRKEKKPSGPFPLDR